MTDKTGGTGALLGPAAVASAAETNARLRTGDGLVRLSRITRRVRFWDRRTSARSTVVNHLLLMFP